MVSQSTLNLYTYNLRESFSFADLEKTEALVQAKMDEEKHRKEDLVLAKQVYRIGLDQVAHWKEHQAQCYRNFVAMKPSSGIPVYLNLDNLLSSLPDHFNSTAGVENALNRLKDYGVLHQVTISFIERVPLLSANNQIRCRFVGVEKLGNRRVNLLHNLICWK